MFFFFLAFYFSGDKNRFLISFLQNKPPDWQDFVGIITLLVINSTISFIEENNAGNAAAALMASLAPKAKVSRIPILDFILINILCIV